MNARDRRVPGRRLRAASGPARLGFSLVLACSLGGLARAGARAPERPGNILFILADDVGVDMVDVYAEGGDPAPMPVIGRLAQEGVLFRNVWATPTCSPTRAAVLTGRHGFRTGIGLFINERSDAELPVDELIFPELLDLHPHLGYRSAAIGKWHLGNEIDAASRAGFETFTGSRANFAKGENYYRWKRIECGVESVCRTYATTDTVNGALEFIASTPEPWFLYLPFHTAHARFQNPPAQLHSMELEARSVVCDPRLVYRAMLQALDTELGRLFDGMGPHLARTHVVFMGDNGTPSEVLAPPILPRHGKLSPYESGLRVPLIIAGPAVHAPGREVTALIQGTDLFATFAELAGLQLPEDLPPGLKTDSVSLLPYLEDPGAAELRGMIYSEMFGPNLSRELFTDVRIVRNERYKLIHRIRPADRWEFFDLLLDPLESRNLMGVPWDRELWNQFESLCSKIDEVRGS